LEYKHFNDYELIYQVREKDEVAYGTLVEKYSHLVDLLAKKYLKSNKGIGLEYDDLYQEGMVGIINALENYDSNETLFYTLAVLCAKREMEKIIKTSKRKKQMILNDSISLNKYVDDEQSLCLYDLIPSDYNLEVEYEKSNTYNSILNYKYDLDFIDSSIFEMKLNGFSCDEIAELLELKRKSVDYHLRKIRKKISKIA